ncbi:MAG: HupE/UreJ family protein [Pseudomonadota bacterium]
MARCAKEMIRVTSVLLALVSAIWATAASSHEVRPAIGDVVVRDDTVELDLTLNLEAFVANIDLEGLTDKDAAEKSPDYDRLRALPAAELEAAFRAFWPRMRDNIRIETTQARVTDLALKSIAVPPPGDIEVPRTSRIVITAPATPPVRIGWAREYGILILRQQGVPDADAYTGLLTAGEITPPLTVSGGASEGALQTFVRYIGVGFAHIIPKGLDHILFILGLFFLAARFSTLFWQVTAFTLAHTVTLALGALEIVRVPGEIVEPLIAASIVFVAVENIFTDGLSRFRPILIFAFGLLHGLGFASVLGEFGLPASQFIPALIGFNVGVEVGQLAVIAAAFLAVGLWFRNKPWYRKAVAIPASVVIAAIGLYWVWERTLA